MLLDEAGSHAKEIGLIYVSDADPGFERRRAGKGFSYLDPQGNKVSSDKVLHRIHSLVIPPAWKNVWICKFDKGHLQATGRDLRQRKQYRYHTDWSKTRNETKFSSLKEFGKVLPELRKKVAQDLELKKLCKEKVLAAVVKTMELTHIRVGNDTYAQENDSYGLTTLKNKHVTVKGHSTNFNFKGKSGVLHTSSLTDPQLAKIISRCQELPGQELFCYVDDKGHAHDINSQHVNEYLKSITGLSLTAKDFRTWGGSREALKFIIKENLKPSDVKKEMKRQELDMIEFTSCALNNTVSVCRKYYIHPEIFPSFQNGKLEKIMKHCPRNDKWLSREEKILMKLIG